MTRTTCTQAINSDDIASLKGKYGFNTDTAFVRRTGTRGQFVNTRWTQVWLVGFSKMLRCRFEYNTHYTLCTRKSCKTWSAYVKKTFADNAKQTRRLFTGDVLRNVMRNGSDELCQFTTYNFEWRSSLMKAYEGIDFQKGENYIFIMNTVCVARKDGRACQYAKKKRSISLALRTWVCT